MSAVVHYLSRRYCFTAECMRKEDGNYEATLARRTPGLVQRRDRRPPKAVTLEADEHFSSTSQSGALSACKQRILELDGEILGEIATDRDDDWIQQPW
jgi:hypothetical protein